MSSVISFISREVVENALGRDKQAQKCNMMAVLLHLYLCISPWGNQFLCSPIGGIVLGMELLAMLSMTLAKCGESMLTS